MSRPWFLSVALVLSVGLGSAQTRASLEPHGVEVTDTEYQGRKAVRLLAPPAAPNGESWAVVKGSAFHNGVLSVDVAGKPAAGAGEGARGFIGLAFRLQDGHYEYIYLRPTNGRAEDQVRRNHSTQYGSHPGFDFDTFRKIAPEKYEAYVDLEPGKWTSVRITVVGTRARLFVHGAEQPTLIVNDLKMGDTQGAVALWVGPGTDGYFANLTITPNKP